MFVRRKFSASNFMNEIREHNCSHMIYIGELCRYLTNIPEQADDAQNPLHSIMGNGMRPDIWMNFKQRYGIKRVCEFYGASEGNVSFANLMNKDMTVGMTSAEVALVEYDVDNDEIVTDHAGKCIPVQQGEPGLLLGKITPDTVFEGYTDAEATEKKVFRNAFEEGDAWFNTGDLVVLQKHGHIQFGDRIGDTFRWQGENVATTEVESVIMKWPEIEDAVVYGVTVPGRDGRCGMLYLTQKEEGKLDLNGLAAHMRDKLPSYAVPRFIRIGQKVDVTGTFKFQKTKLKNAAYKIDEVDDPLYVLARDADGVEPINAEVQGKIDNDELRL